MEEKQLDFNAPLLSVRRFSSMGAPSKREESKRTENSVPKIPALPCYKPELKSGPVRDPGEVPFRWEQIPGRPKGEGVNQPRSLKRPPIAPKLPPGRILDGKQQQPSNKESEKSNVVRPQNNNILSSRKTFSSLDEDATNLKSSKEGVKEKGDSDDDDDDVFSDALDTLSRNESFFLNCSVSGLSGLEGPDVKPSGTFLTDPQTRDFMMGRFLPAAKAMASETPHYASRKQLMVRAQPGDIKKVVSRDRQPPPYHYRPNIVPQFAQDKSEEDSEDEGDDYDDTRNLSAKACGLLPRFCLNNSFCLLNPVPGMKVRTRMPMHSARKVRTQLKTTYAGTHSERDDERTWDTVYTHKLVRELQTHEVHEDESKQTSESNQLTCWSDSQTPDGSSPYGHSVGGGISPYRNEASQSFFHEGMGFLGIPKEKNLKASGFDSYDKNCNKFQEELSHKSSKEGSGSSSPMVEKTLYVDSVQVVENPNSNLSPSVIRELMDSPDKDSEVLVESKRMEEPLAESCLLDINHLHIPLESGVLQPEILAVVDAAIPSSEKSNLGGHMDRVEDFRQDGSLVQESKALVCSNASTNGKLDFENQHPLKSDDQGYSYVNAFQSPLPPPLPKSPSESWLWRTLPSISSRNSSSRAYLGAQFHSKKQDSKWETIVKISNVHHGHLRFSEELIRPIPEQSET